MVFGLKETVDYLIKLQIKAQSFCNKSPYSKDDIRHAGFLHILGVIQPLIIIYNVSLAVQKNQIPDHIYQPLFGMKQEWAHQQFPALNVFSGIALITEFHFGLEVFLKNILNKLEQTTPTKFHEIAKQLLDKITISEKKEKYDILMTASHMRNVYHSNGIHTNRTRSPVTIKKLEFEFIKSKQPECANSEHVCVLIDEILSMMEEIVTSSEVVQIKEKIPDQYIPDNNYS